MSRCVNCGIMTTRCNTLGGRVLDHEPTLALIRQWRASELVSRSDSVCNPCWNLAQQALQGQQTDNPVQVSHRSVCLRCGRSLLMQRVSHLLHTESVRESRIYNVIQEWIIPHVIPEECYICHACWVAADRAADHMTTGPSTSSKVPEVIQREDPVILQSPPQDPPHNPACWVAADHITTGPSTSSQIPEVIQREDLVIFQSPPQDPPHDPNIGHRHNQPAQTIILPSYMRAVDTENRCFVEGCRRTERYRVPLSMRKILLNQYNYYIPQKNRFCEQHLLIAAWDFFDSLSNNYSQSFNADQIQDMISLKEVSNSSLLNFESINEMDDHIVHLWLGFTKPQFQKIIDEVPQILQIKRGALALAAYLIKLRTGDSNERISSLLKISRRSLERWLVQIRDMLSEYFVPRHLGINHLNRQEIIQKNLTIPSALFGNHNGVTVPIIIFDGTYCFIEKSSNYLYQKRTYSLHKYRNLVKPFLIVCTDGHIIDVLGPYPATTSDADIMKKEFSNNAPLREYFVSGDAFILDRGFRDSLSLLNQCGYRSFVPASLQEGETQLSTIEANKSRAVTICRWVVEVVNGRFKRDFKLLRQNYFNVASKSLFKDFEVAAALLNTFHPPIVDNLLAGEIIEQINIHMHTENELGNLIIRYNYNRRTADFNRINVDNENLLDFPQLTYNELILISLGIYQLKQARSYYGEHVRDNDGFVIEVCREVNSSLLRELSTSNDTWLLRGRIQSRHISRKTYFVYILVDSSRTGREAIIQYYCNCIVGKRTVGCCAHVMAIIWYLSWARYQDNIVPPAQFLDDILIIVEEE